ncbi:phosphotransferase enzyme family protein [Microlunatus speluncae]|uniref:phosphotransferase enzyme family protein n=1 Tax=Microlunatus speluncae TaxID=2594267 RepID=UPI001375A096|nr:aminoglycoside phosphotransferase family protein [Microlunatus speluncae]
MGNVDPGPFLAAALGAEAGTAERIRRGAIGAIWRLSLTGHRSGTLAAKEFITYPPEERDVANEIALRNAAAAVGVPSPEPIAFRTGNVAMDPRTGRGWRCYDWVDGQQAADDRETRLWLLRQLAAIHQLARTEPAPTEHDWYLRVHADWDALVSDVRAAGLPWAARFERLVEERVAGLAALIADVPAGTPIWTHRDLQPANVMVDAADGRRRLVDWDNAGGLSDWRELGSQLIHWLHSPADLRLAYETYLTAGGSARVTGPAVFATAVAGGLNFLAEQVRRLVDPTTSDDDHDYAEGWLPGLLDEVPHPDRLIAAARLLSERR